MDALYACSERLSMIEIPEFYRDLLSSAGAATLSVLSKNGSIQSTMVWPGYDGQLIKLNMVLKKLVLNAMGTLLYLHVIAATRITN